MKICVIGCGWIAKRVHGDAYKHYVSTHPEAVLAACCDINEAAASDFRDSVGFQAAYTDMDQMLEEQKPDAVCVNVPYQVMRETALRVVNRNIPLIMEKPPGATAADVRLLAEAIDKAAVPNMVAFNRRFMPLIVKLKEALAGKQALDISCEFYRYGRANEDFTTTALHALDSVMFIKGMPYKQAFFYYHDASIGERQALNVTVHAVFEDDTAATMRFIPTGGCIIERITVNTIGETFFVKLPVWGALDVPGTFTHVIKDKVVEKYTDAPDMPMFVSNGFYRENEVFFDSVKAGTVMGNDIHTAILPVTIADYMRGKAPCYP